MLKEAIFATIISFAVSGVVCKVSIPFLHRLKFGQQVRQDGPETHLKKAGTPTMGGISILAAVTATVLLFSLILKDFSAVPLLLVTLGYGLVGFLDDFLKIKKKQSEGLKAWQKMGLQIVFTVAYVGYLFFCTELGTDIVIPFTGITVNIGWFFIPFAIFVIIGTDNGVNFTDGLDGLCSEVTIPIAFFFAFIFLEETQTANAVMCTSVAGALMGFLLFNSYPAKIFMGDTGALSLGAFVAAAAISVKMPLILVVVGFVYMCEVLSVIIQVGYFRLTHGKRFFKMAPIHHHFEKCGWSETRIVNIFTIITILLCLTAVWAVGKFI